METLRFGDLEIWRAGDLESWRLGDLERWRAGDLESLSAGELETWSPGKLESWRPGELETLSKDSLARTPQPGIFYKSVWGLRWNHLASCFIFHTIIPARPQLVLRFVWGHFLILYGPFWGQEGFKNDPEPYGSVLF